MRYQAAFTLFAVFTAYTIGANASNKSDIQELKQRMACLEQRKGCCAETGCPTCSPDPDSNTAFYVWGEGLYWKAAESGLTSVIKAVSGQEVLVGLSANIHGIKSKHPHFDWHWGFRIGAGYNMCHDLWDVYSEWTRFHFTDRKVVSVPSGGSPTSGVIPVLFPFWIPKISTDIFPPTTLVRSETHWKVQLDMIDLQLGRQFYVTNCLVLKPHLGLRVGWILQSYNIEDLGGIGSFDIPTAFTMNMRNNFWGVGLIGGLDSIWNLGRGFSIYGNGAVSILDGHFINRFVFFDGVRLNEDAPFGIGVQFDNKSHQNMAVFVADLALGVRWDRSFWCDRIHVGVRAGYEQHIYFEQNQFMNYQNDFAIITALPNYYADGGNLSTNGITVGMEIGY